MAPSSMSSAPIPVLAILARLHASDESSWARYIRSAPRPSAAAVQAAKKTKEQVSRADASDSSHSLEADARSTSPAQSISSVRGRIWALSQDAQGSRDVQALFEVVGNADLEELALELQGHIAEAARCPHANFVLQKCIGPFLRNATRTIARELGSQGPVAIVQIARHRYGCRIVERLLAFCEDAEANELADVLLDDAKSLCMHPYGNYTMQHLITHGSEHRRRRLLTVLRDEAAAMGSNFHASAVVAEALRRGSPRDALALAHALVGKPGLLAQMARTKHGHVAARLAVHAIDASKM